MQVEGGRYWSDNRASEGDKDTRDIFKTVYKIEGGILGVGVSIRKVAKKAIV